MPRSLSLSHFLSQLSLSNAEFSISFSFSALSLSNEEVSLSLSLSRLPKSKSVNMQPNFFLFYSVYGNNFLMHRDLTEDFESSRAFIFVLFLLLQGSVMALLRFGHGGKISSRKVQQLRSQW